jgi:hypothetical protein
MKRLLQKCSMAIVVLAIPLFSGCVGYVYDGGIGVGGGWGYGGGWHHGGGWGHGGGYHGGHGGGWGRGGSRGGGWGHGGRHEMGVDAMSADDVMSDTDGLLETSSAVSENSANLLARNYEISVQSAQKILQIASGKVSKKSLRDVGLVSEDVKLLKKLEMPSDQTILRISAALGEDSWKIQNLIQGFVSDLQREAD